MSGTTVGHRHDSTLTQSPGKRRKLNDEQSDLRDSPRRITRSIVQSCETTPQRSSQVIKETGNLLSDKGPIIDTLACTPQHLITSVDHELVKASRSESASAKRKRMQPTKSESKSGNNSPRKTPLLRHGQGEPTANSPPSGTHNAIPAVGCAASNLTTCESGGLKRRRGRPLKHAIKSSNNSQKNSPRIQKEMGTTSSDTGDQTPGTPLTRSRSLSKRPDNAGRNIFSEIKAKFRKSSKDKRANMPAQVGPRSSDKKSRKSLDFQDVKTNSAREELSPASDKNTGVCRRRSRDHSTVLWDSTGNISKKSSDSKETVGKIEKTDSKESTSTEKCTFSNAANSGNRACVKLKGKSDTKELNGESSKLSEHLNGGQLKTDSQVHTYPASEGDTDKQFKAQQNETYNSSASKGKTRLTRDQKSSENMHGDSCDIVGNKHIIGRVNLSLKESSVTQLTVIESSSVSVGKISDSPQSSRGKPKSTSGKVVNVNNIKPPNVVSLLTTTSTRSQAAESPKAGFYGSVRVECETVDKALPTAELRTSISSATECTEEKSTNIKESSAHFNDRKEPQDEDLKMVDKIPHVMEVEDKTEEKEETNLDSHSAKQRGKDDITTSCADQRVNDDKITETETQGADDRPNEGKIKDTQTDSTMQREKDGEITDPKTERPVASSETTTSYSVETAMSVTCGQSKDFNYGCDVSCARNDMRPSATERPPAGTSTFGDGEIFSNEGEEKMETKFVQKLESVETTISSNQGNKSLESLKTAFIDGTSHSAVGERGPDSSFGLSLKEVSLTWQTNPCDAPKTETCVKKDYQMKSESKKPYSAQKENNANEVKPDTGHLESTSDSANNAENNNTGSSEKCEPPIAPSNNTRIDPRGATPNPLTESHLVGQDSPEKLLNKPVPIHDSIATKGVPPKNESVTPKRSSRLQAKTQSGAPKRYDDFFIPSVHKKSSPKSKNSIEECKKTEKQDPDKDESNSLGVLASDSVSQSTLAKRNDAKMPKSPNQSEEAEELSSLVPDSDTHGADATGRKTKVKAGRPFIERKLVMQGGSSINKAADRPSSSAKIWKAESTSLEALNTKARHKIVIRKRDRLRLKKLQLLKAGKFELKGNWNDTGISESMGIASALNTNPSQSRPNKKSLKKKSHFKVKFASNDFLVRKTSREPKGNFPLKMKFHRTSQGLAIASSYGSGSTVHHHDQEKCGPDTQDRGGGSTAKSQTTRPRKNSNKKAKVMPRAIINVDDLMKNETLAEHAFTLWKSDKAAEIERLHQRKAPDQLESVLRRCWLALPHDDQRKYFLRVLAALTDENKHSPERFIAAFPPGAKCFVSGDSENTTSEAEARQKKFQAVLERKLMVFKQMSAEKQHNLLKQNFLCVQRMLSKERYAHFVLSLKQTILDLRSHRMESLLPDDVTNREVLEQESRDMMFLEVLKEREAFREDNIRLQAEAAAEFRTKFQNFVAHLINGGEVSSDSTTRCQDLRHALVDLQDLEKRSRISVSGDVTRSDSFESLVRDIRTTGEKIRENLAKKTMSVSVNKPVEGRGILSELPTVSEDNSFVELLLQENATSDLQPLEPTLLEDVLQGQERNAEDVTPAQPKSLPNSEVVTSLLGDAVTAMETLVRGTPCCDLKTPSCILSTLLILEKMTCPNTS